MATFLFDDIVFGPIKSRRLGLSLGINIFPQGRKICSYNCIYCECGWTDAASSNEFVSTEIFKSAINEKCRDLKSKNIIPDSLTFAGNGESTLHPEFYQIMSLVVEARNEFFPEAKVSVLSNFQTPWHENTEAALLLSDRNILKLDSAIQEEFENINQPEWPINIDDLISKLQNFRGKKTIQTLLFRGEFKGKKINNASQESLLALSEAIQKIQPEEWMIYPLERDTPATGLQKHTLEELEDAVRFLSEKTHVKISLFH